MPKAGQYNHHISTCIHPTIFDNTYYYSTMVGATSISTFLPSFLPSYKRYFLQFRLKIGQFLAMFLYYKRVVKNIARIVNAVPITLYSRVTMQLILLFSIVRNVSSVSSVKSQVTSL